MFLYFSTAYHGKGSGEITIYILITIKYFAQSMPPGGLLLKSTVNLVSLASDPTFIYRSPIFKKETETGCAIATFKIPRTIHSTVVTDSLSFFNILSTVGF